MSQQMKELENILLEVRGGNISLQPLNAYYLKEIFQLSKTHQKSVQDEEKTMEYVNQSLRVNKFTYVIVQICFFAIYLFLVTFISIVLIRDDLHVPIIWSVFFVLASIFMGALLRIMLIPYLKNRILLLQAYQQIVAILKEKISIPDGEYLLKTLLNNVEDDENKLLNKN